MQLTAEEGYTFSVRYSQVRYPLEIPLMNLFFES